MQLVRYLLTLLTDSIFNFYFILGSNISDLDDNKT